MDQMLAAGLPQVTTAGGPALPLTWPDASMTWIM